MPNVGAEQCPSAVNGSPRGNVLGNTLTSDDEAFLSTHEIYDRTNQLDVDNAEENSIPDQTQNQYRVMPPVGPVSPPASGYCRF